MPFGGSFWCVASACFLLGGAAARAEPEFSGHWRGRGTFQSEDMPQAAAADFDVVIRESDSRLVVEECWTAGDGRKKTCYHSDYEVAGEQILRRGKKIGDIFPGKISVYLGNSQVSELMTFRLNGGRELLFRYAYSNMDGNILTKFARLPEWKR